MGVSAVVFLALTFLLVAAMLMARGEGPIDPAFADDQQVSTAVVLRADGSIVWRGHLYDLTAFTAALQAPGPRGRGQMHVLADHHAPASEAISLFTAVSRSGATGVALAVF
ncbi:MAG: biopolymer transporter ExbD [Bauldia sp.]